MLGAVWEIMKRPVTIPRGTAMTTARTKMVRGILLLVLLLLVVLGVWGWVMWEFSQSMDFD